MCKERLPSSSEPHGQSTEYPRRKTIRIDWSKQIGKKFHRLTMLQYIPGERARALVKCDCGTIKITLISALQCGDTKSCGCYNIELAKEKGRKIGKIPRFTAKHRQTRPKTYRAWLALRTRCDNPKSKYYYRYGGRGIAYTERWKSFEAFLEDMGDPPSKTHSLDRINNDGNYFKENCKWSTPKEQSLNSSRTYMITHEGITMCASDWAKKFKVHACTVAEWYKKGIWKKKFIEKMLQNP